MAAEQHNNDKLQVWHIYDWKTRFEVEGYCRLTSLLFVREFVGVGFGDAAVAYHQELEDLDSFDNHLVLRGAFQILRTKAGIRSRFYRGYLLDQRNRPAANRMIARWLGVSLDEVGEILEALREVGLIELVDLPDFEKIEKETMAAEAAEKAAKEAAKKEKGKKGAKGKKTTKGANKANSGDSAPVEDGNSPAEGDSVCDPAEIPEHLEPFSNPSRTENGIGNGKTEGQDKFKSGNGKTENQGQGESESTSPAENAGQSEGKAKSEPVELSNGSIVFKSTGGNKSEGKPISDEEMRERASQIIARKTAKSEADAAGSSGQAQVDNADETPVKARNPPNPTNSDALGDAARQSPSSPKRHPEFNHENLEHNLRGIAYFDSPQCARFAVEFYKTIGEPMSAMTSPSGAAELGAFASRWYQVMGMNLPAEIEMKIWDKAMVIAGKQRQVRHKRQYKNGPGAVALSQLSKAIPKIINGR